MSYPGIPSAPQLVFRFGDQVGKLQKVANPARLRTVSPLVRFGSDSSNGMSNCESFAMSGSPAADDSSGPFSRYVQVLYWNKTHPRPDMGLRSRDAACRLV
jgi:hypothetical protein